MATITDSLSGAAGLGVDVLPGLTFSFPGMSHLAPLLTLCDWTGFRDRRLEPTGVPNLKPGVGGPGSCMGDSGQSTDQLPRRG